MLRHDVFMISSTGTVILESKVCPNTAYQKQQETLICWSENEQELALSFQLMESCSEIWEKICDVSSVLSPHWL